MKKFSISIYLLLFIGATTLIHAQAPNLQAEKTGFVTILDKDNKVVSNFCLNKRDDESYLSA